MIKIDDEYYLDDNDQLCRFDGNVDKGEIKDTIKEILVKLYQYEDDGKKISNNGNEFTTSQYIGELKKAVNRKLAGELNFSSDKGRETDELFDKLAELAPNEISDTLGHIFRHELKENFISDWLAYIINPNKMGTNATFQTLFNVCHIAGTFIPVGDIEREKELIYYDDNDECKNCGRIDIFTRTETAIVGIENKILSDFTSNDQLDRYKEALQRIAENESKNWYLFLLYPLSNTKIKNYKIEQCSQNNVFKLTYEALIERFERIKIDCVKSLRQMIIFEDFIKHIKEYVMVCDNNFNFSAIKFLDDNSQKIVQLDQIRNGANEQLKDYFNKCLCKKLEGDNWEIRVSSGCQYIQCYQKTWGDSKIHFELKNTVQKNEVTNFPPKHFVLEFHDERKPKSEKLKELSRRIKKELVYEIDYTSEDNLNESIKKMMDALKESINHNLPEIDKLLKSENSPGLMANPVQE